MFFTPFRLPVLVDHSYKISIAVYCILILAVSSCSRDYIPNTRIEDTDKNRELMRFIDRYRMAVESRDISMLLSLTSVNYFDDMGTPIGDDDVDFETLKKGLMRLKKEIQDTRYQINYRGMTHLSDRIMIDVLYTGWYRLTTEEGPQWRRVLEEHRLVVAKEGGKYKILSGM